MTVAGWALIVLFLAIGLVILLAMVFGAIGVVAQLQPNVIASVKLCRDGWCRVVIGTETTGFIKQDRLWGVYPNEIVD